MIWSPSFEIHLLFWILKALMMLTFPPFLYVLVLPSWNWKWLRQPARCCPSCRSGKGTRNTSPSVSLLYFQSIWADRHSCDGVWLSVFGALKVSDYPLLSSCPIARLLQKYSEEALPVTNDCWAAAAFYFLICSPLAGLCDEGGLSTPGFGTGDPT